MWCLAEETLPVIHTYKGFTVREKGTALSTLDFLVDSREAKLPFISALEKWKSWDFFSFLIYPFNFTGQSPRYSLGRVSLKEGKFVLCSIGMSSVFLSWSNQPPPSTLT